MAISDILASIDNEIAKLQSARTLLSSGELPEAKKSVGRPKKATSIANFTEKVATKKRNLSPEGRKRIAEAVKKRWAAQKSVAKRGNGGTENDGYNISARRAK